MNEITAARKRIPGIIRAIDEITFQASILKLNAAVEAAGGRCRTPWSAEAATQTLALIEDSINRSPVFLGARCTGGNRELLAGADELHPMAEKLNCIPCAAPDVATNHSIGEPR